MLSWHCSRSRSLPLDAARLLAILNITPDSFFDGGKLTDPAAALARAEQAANEGADMLDIGGESTRPGSSRVAAHEQLARVLPVIRSIRNSRGPANGLPISIDTTLLEVALAALDEGADAINDVSAGLESANSKLHRSEILNSEFPNSELHNLELPNSELQNLELQKSELQNLELQNLKLSNPESTSSNSTNPESPTAARHAPSAIFTLAAQRGAGLILMHRLAPPALDRFSDQYGTPPCYGNVVKEVGAFLAARAAIAISTGVPREAIVLDPGLGFGKSVEQNMELIRRTGELAAIGFPILSALSRKSFVGRVSLNRDSTPDERLPGTLALSTAHFIAGARLFRVHDVQAHAQSLRAASQCHEGQWLRPPTGQNHGQ